MPMYPDKARAGQRYQPSNGTEGEAFIGAWCGRCERDKDQNGTAYVENRDPGDDDWCPILTQSFVDDGSKEWVFDANGMPSCTGFVPLGEKVPQPRCEHTQELPF